MHTTEQMTELHKKAASHYTPEELHDYGEEQMLELCLCFADDSTEKMMKIHQLCKTLIALNTLRQQYIKEHEQLFAGIEEAAYNDLLNMLNDHNEHVCLCYHVFAGSDLKPRLLNRGQRC